MSNIVPFERIDAKDILKLAQEFPHSGLLIAQDHYIYVKVANEFISELYPLLKNYVPDAEIPDYLADQREGAHITTMYPEENIVLTKTDLSHQYNFEISGVYTAVLGPKKYYVLGVICPALLELRAKYGLGPKLLFRNYLVDLHITIGKAVLNI